MSVGSTTSSPHERDNSISEEDGCSTNFGDDEDTENAKVKAAREERLSLGLRESQAVRALRIVTLFVLLSTAALVTTGVYFISRYSEEETFQSEYEAGANQVIKSFHISVEQFLGSFDALASIITSHAIDSGSTFPNVTVPDFEVHADATRVLSQAPFVQYLPLVTDEIRKEWEAYATENQGHLIPAFAKEMGLKGVQDAKYNITKPEEEQGNRELQESTAEPTFQEEIWSFSGPGETEVADTGPYYLPIWQISPVLPYINFLNFNTLDLAYFQGPYNDILNNAQAALGVMTHLNDDAASDNDAIKILNAWLSLGQYRHTLAEYTEDPITAIAYPVFDNFIPDRKIVAVLGTALYWRFLFTDVLPPSGTGFIVVVENSFGQAETYRIDGPTVTYVGIGDLHEIKYDHMEIMTKVADSIAAEGGVETRSYTAVDLNSDYLDYTVHVYPSTHMEDKFVTNEPIYYAVVVAAIFLFTTVVFMVYNCLVERRQRLVLDKAVKSTAVVKSLFPENVRERLYEETEKALEDNKRSSSKNTSGDKWSNNAAANGNLTKFLSTGELMEASEAASIRKGSPIADLFPESTVFFADLAGFTKWSSERKPTEVFGLLETIYGAFDRIAQRRKVFKVETIGDCYVAVTGVPEAQPDHALIMTKFSADCMLKLRQLLIKMAGEYGEDTEDLCLRIGLHSGAVTAGVLRGDRGRFQLFGDTVNTAARMESNGIPGRIHCSQDTVDRLLLAGKESWVKLRETTIHAKGKGEMQTYWLEPSRSKTAVTATSVVSLPPAIRPESTTTSFSAKDSGQLPRRPSGSGHTPRSPTSHSSDSIPEEQHRTDSED
jgi:class 3 adenylate cyclase